MTQHPRAIELKRLILATKAAGEQIAGVEVRWDGETPVWTILTKEQREEGKAGGGEAYRMVKDTSLPYTWTHPRSGIVYYRRHGRMVSLGRTEEKSFLSRYEAAHGGAAPPPSNTRVSSLIDSYRRSTRWDGLAERTRTDYAKVLDYLAEKIGARDVSAITRPLILDAMEANRHRARFANYIAQVAGILCEHAIDLGWRRENSVRGVRKLRLGDGWEAWPDAALAAYRTVATGRAELICELCLGTAQRIGDVREMRWSDIEGNGIWIRQNKTDTRLYVPFTPRLASLLARTPRPGLTILAGRHGKPLTHRQVAHAVDAARRESGTLDWVIHGWRYNAVDELYAAGCSDAEVQAISGHATTKMARKYGRGSQKRRAEAARERTKNERET